MAGREQGGAYGFSDDGTTSSSLVDYPVDRPFVNDDYRRDSSKPLYAYPESNRKDVRTAVMSALYGLQEKIQKLELERRLTEDSIHSVSAETSRLQASLDRSHEREPNHVTSPLPRESHVQEAPPAERQESSADRLEFSADDLRQTSISRDTQELESQLTAAEGRCGLLERQLDYMRKMVTSSDGPSHTLPPSSSPSAPQAHRTDSQTLTYRDKLCDLEREHLKLSATQTIAENKIRELEGRLKDEKEQRKKIQQRAAQVETRTAASRILGSYDARARAPRDKGAGRKRSGKKEGTGSRVKRESGRGGKAAVLKPSRPDLPSSRGSSKSSSRSEVGVPMDHYRLDLKHMPFVVGQSTSRSHNVNVNLQKVLSMLKHHNTEVCGAAKKGELYTRRRSPASSSSRAAAGLDLSDLLDQLQHEFSNMTFEHQELLGQLQEARDSGVREDLERELDALVARMEAKSSQIAQLSRHQRQLKKGKKEKKEKSRAARPASAPAKRRAPPAVAAANTVRKPAPSDSHTAQNLKLLKEFKTLQNTLHRDDIQWD